MGGRVVARTRAHASPGLSDVVVIAFAANRVARALSIDSISAPLRERLQRPPRRTSADSGLRRFTADLLDCPVCTGWWASIGLSMMWQGGYRLRRGLAVAGVQVVISLAERLLSEEGRIALREAEVIVDRPMSDDEQDA